MQQTGALRQPGTAATNASRLLAPGDRRRRRVIAVMGQPIGSRANRRHGALVARGDAAESNLCDVLQLVPGLWSHDRLS